MAIEQKTDAKVAYGLAWFSIGLGLAEVLAPRQIGEALGLEKRTILIRFYGVREIGAGLGILTQFDGMLAPWIWGRVGGDALDIGTLALAVGKNNRKRGADVALAIVAAIAALDVWCARSLSARGR